MTTRQKAKAPCGHHEERAEHSVGGMAVTVVRALEPTVHISALHHCSSVLLFCENCCYTYLKVTHHARGYIYLVERLACHLD